MLALIERERKRAGRARRTKNEAKSQQASPRKGRTENTLSHVRRSGRALK
jgi:hypothetical protein